MDWTTLVAQIPIVAVFVWYAIETTKQNGITQTKFLEALEKRDQEYEKRNTALCGSLESLTSQISKLTERTIVHDEFSRTAVGELRHKEK